MKTFRIIICAIILVAGSCLGMAYAQSEQPSDEIVVLKWTRENIMNVLHNSRSYFTAVKETSHKHKVPRAIAAARKYVRSIFNPADSSLAVSDLTIKNGILYMFMRLFGGDKFVEIPVQVDLKSRKVTIDQHLIDAATKARAAAATGLQLPYKSIQISNILGYAEAWPGGDNGLDIVIENSGLILTFRYSIPNDKLNLASLIDTKTGQDLLRNAASYLGKIMGARFELDVWSISGGFAEFTFAFADGLRLTITGTDNYDETGLLRRRNFEGYAYDASGSILYSHHSTVTYGYYRNGALKDEECEYYNYDTSGNLIKYVTMSRLYDKSGRETSMSSETRVYDSNGRLLQITYVEDFDVEMFGKIGKKKSVAVEYYNSDGTIKKKISESNLYSPEGNLMSTYLIEATYEYDENGHLRKMTQIQTMTAPGRGIVSLTETTTVYDYNPDGTLKSEVTEVNWPIGTVMDIMGHNINSMRSAITYDYDYEGDLRIKVATGRTERYYTQGDIQQLASYDEYITTCKYNQGGMLVSENSVCSTFGAISRPHEPRRPYETYNRTKIYSYHENGKLKELTDEGSQYNTAAGRIIFSYRETQKYDENGRLIEDALEERFDVPDSTMYHGHLYSTATFEYDESGKLTKRRDTGRHENIIGAPEYSYEQEVTYDGDNNIKTLYYVESGFDEATGKLQSKSGVIFMESDKGEISWYSVGYNIDENGQVVYTHVYDIDGNEIKELGGEGDINPADIIKKANDSTAELYGHNEEGRIDPEILQRRAVEVKAWAQAADKRFVDEMAARKKNILSAKK